MEEWLTSDPCFWRTLSTLNTVFGLEDQAVTPVGRQMASNNEGVWPMHSQQADHRIAPWLLSMIATRYI